MKIWREMEKEAATWRKHWVDSERAYDDNGEVNGKRMWKRRTETELQADYDKYVRAGHWERIKERHMSRAQPKMEFMWEMQANFVKAKHAVAERLGLDDKYWFITIRPDTNKVTFGDFYAKVVKFISGKSVLKYHLAFEQTGATEDDLGKGFHVHIVADMTYTKKRDVLNACNKFLPFTAENCIDVQRATRPQGIIDKYLKGISDDGHKEALADMVALWRTRLGLLEIYSDEQPLPKTWQQPIKSTRLLTFSIAEVSDDAST